MLNQPSFILLSIIKALNIINFFRQFNLTLEYGINMENGPNGRCLSKTKIEVLRVHYIET